jgi:hypothetical protein
MEPCAFQPSFETARVTDPAGPNDSIQSRGAATSSLAAMTADRPSGAQAMSRTSTPLAS